MTRRHHGIAAACALLLVATGCGGKEKRPSGAAPKPSPSTTAVAPALCPLTGTPAGTTNTARPALAVKIDNAAPARPQAGLDSADVVYEELAEGGITRFVVIFHCKDAARVGPIRSARLVDPDLLKQYKTILFAYSGANPTVLAKVKGTPGVVSVEHGSNGPAYERVKGRRAPHNLFSATDKLYSRAATVQGAPVSGLVFESPPAPGAPPPPAPAGTGPGASATFSFAGRPDHKYTYDAGSGSYVRFQGLNTPFNLEGAGQARATNIVFLKVKPVSGELIDFSVVGSGQAIVLRGGVSVTGSWARPSLDDQIKLADAGGSAIKLNPGNTWIHLLPESQGVNLG